MSIIHDALKKVEKNVNEQPGPDKEKAIENRKTRRKLYLIYALVVAIGALAANLAYSYLTSSQNKSFTRNKKITKANPLARVMPEPKQALTEKIGPAVSITRKEPSQAQPFVLSGIFFSQNEGYALVNDKIVKNGDKVDGAVVKKVGLDEVELEQEGKTIKLYNR
ncbi:MAG: hypothetical protein A3K83_07110 [Omnitrophica WOR_2 bacterium RBG_13_44_8b]|nr:MAG: hypothetical protein A3K83_07110 [Omnitrophica WOR_2 bacterium RBG_13_44_8b]